MTTADWSLRRYGALCRALLEGPYAPWTMAGYLSNGPSRAVVLRHDVDRFPGDALAMARLESSLGIGATYYLRMVPGVFSPELAREIAALGHEVGYHYEVLAKARGHMDAALARFAEELAELRRHVPVATATAHGSPLSPWDSLAIWEHAGPEDFDLLGEPYLAPALSHLAYYTDTGRSWQADKTNLRDRPGSGGAGTMPMVPDTARLEALLRTGELPGICLQTHPERWHDPGLGRIRSQLLDLAANTVKRILALSGRAGYRTEGS